MKKSRLYVCLSISLALASILASCASDEGAKKAETQQTKTDVASPATLPLPAPESHEQTAEKQARATAQSELESLVVLYNNGDFQTEIKRFNSNIEVLKPFKDLELLGLKYTAFSYCLIGRKALCKQQFEKAFKLDPTFDLKDGEKGHPIWGKVFDRVKKKDGAKPQKS
jgi:hypothetical protein